MMGTGDGSVIGTTKISDYGAAAERFNIILVAEGFQETELTQFQNHAQDFVNHLFTTPPFDTMEPAINIYRIDVSSTESGANDPIGCGGSGATPATYFDASFCNSGIKRLLAVDSTLVQNVVTSQVPQWHQIIVIVNSTVWGGSGGSISTTSVAPGWENIAIHELGHAAFGLADEYSYWSGCGVDTNRDHYTGSEPLQANITTETNRNALKWGHLVDPTTPLPTTTNTDCTICDAQPSSVPPETVGAFEGGGYYHCELYRPEFSCMMRNLSDFCEVCQERIRTSLQPHMPHVDFHERPEHFFDFRIIPEWVLERWILVAYLIVNWHMKDLQNKAKIQPDRRFYRVVAKYLASYIQDGKMPPHDIAAAILNLADDYMSDRKMCLRAGDYIAIQNHIRRIK